MTESTRRSSDYEYPYDEQPSGYAQQHASSPVSPEWPAPPVYQPAMETPAMQASGMQAAGVQAPGMQAAGMQAPGMQAAGVQAPGVQAAGVQAAGVQAAGVQAAGVQAAGGDGGAVGGGAATALLSEPIAQPPRAQRRNRGPIALLTSVAIVAAMIGGGTAYGIQELTGNDSVAAVPATTTNVVPSSQRGTVSGVAKAVSPSIVEINATSNAGSSTGSGVISTSDGEIITNNHVISGATSIKVKTSDGKEYTAEVVGTDSSKDLALIQLKNASGLKAASLGDSDDVQVGDEVVAIGSPEGLTGTVTSGIVSALDRDVTVSKDEGQDQQDQGSGWPFEFGGQEFNGDTGSSTTTYKAIQTDASLNPGNSGGALIDMNGNIIGINSAMYSSSGSGSSDAGSVGLGFAIPINTVKADLAKLRSGSQT